MSADGARLVLEGFLQKRKDTVKIIWSTYWFRLQNTTLFFYTRKNGDASHLRGYYYIYTVQSVREVQRTDSRRFMFEIIMKNGKRKTLAAETAALRKQWVGQLWKAMHLCGCRDSDRDEREQQNTETWSQTRTAVESPPSAAAAAASASASAAAAAHRDSSDAAERKGDDVLSRGDGLYDVLPSTNAARGRDASARTDEGVYDTPVSNRPAVNQASTENIYNTPGFPLRKISDHMTERQQDDTFWNI